MKPNIPKGWRELKQGQIIRAGDKYWHWNQGPFEKVTKADIWHEETYTPHDTNKGEVTTHWVHIRRIAKKAGGKRK